MSRGARAGVRPIDLLREATFGVTVKPVRTLLTIVGITVGIAALVATTGLAATATRVVSERFDDLRAREVRIVGGRVGALPTDIDHRVAQLPGVRSGGVLGPASQRPVPVGSLPLGPRFEVPILPATAGGLDAARATIEGRSFDGMVPAGSMALVGRDLADSLGIVIRSRPVMIFVGDSPISVVGIIEDTVREPELLGAVVVPAGDVVELTGEDDVTVLIDVDPGSARRVASDAPLALAPHDPDLLLAQLLPEARGLRTDVVGELDALGLGISATVLGVAGLAVAATMTLSVLERRREIGLHRALGARPFHVGLRFLTESIVVGAVGGLLGASAGVIVVAVSASIRQVVPVLPVWVPAAAVGVGVAVTVIAGAYPAVRAARLDPIDALRP